MYIEVQTFTVNKLVALTISRGTNYQSTNVWLKISEEGIIGWGEGAAFSIGSHTQTTPEIVTALENIIPKLSKLHPLQRQEIDNLISDLPSSAKNAIDVALWDWLGKKVNLPLWQLWGLDLKQIKPISVTIGINTPQGAIDRIRQWFTVYDGNFLKIKLGNPQGITADQAMMLAVKKEAPEAKLTVDANGGWNSNDALIMSNWLADLGVEYIEQPLSVEEDSKLIELTDRSPLPIFVDESCFNSQDIPRLARLGIAGINIKLMKAGGLTAALKMIYTARSCGLKVMFGCYGDSCLSNTAAAQLSPLADYLDLDSHLNLKDDPFMGARLSQGSLIPNNLPGLGVNLKINDGY